MPHKLFMLQSMPGMDCSHWLVASTRATGALLVRFPYSLVVCLQEMERAAMAGVEPHVSDAVCDLIRSAVESGIVEMNSKPAGTFTVTHSKTEAGHLQAYAELLKASDTLLVTVKLTWRPAADTVLLVTQIYPTPLQ